MLVFWLLLSIIAKKFSNNMSDIKCQKNSYSIIGKALPVLPGYGFVANAGFPSPAADFVEEEIDLNKYLIPRPNATYIVRAVGDSMINAHIPDNTLLVVDRSIKPVSNRIVVAIINNEFTIKRFIQNSSGIRLVPESPNPRYKPIPIVEGMDFSIWGVVTHIIIKATDV
jgi:DNA polymerase V